MKSDHFGMGSYLIILYIIGYNNIAYRPNDPHDSSPKILAVATLQSPEFTPVIESTCGMVDLYINVDTPEPMW